MHKIYSDRIKKLTETNKKVLVGYLLAGYKNHENFFENLRLCEDSEVGIYEISYPSQNPYADGEVISHAHSMVDFEESTSVEFWKKIRKATDKPIWLMAYNNDFIKSGKYIEFAKAEVIDGIVIPDTDIDARLKLQEELKQYKIDVVGFANPSLNENELKKVLDGFALVYEQLYVGQTGMAHPKEEYHEMLNYTKNHGEALPFAGFGLNSYEKVNKVLNEGFYGAIIGTEFIKRINKSSENLKEFLQEISKAVL